MPSMSYCLFENTYKDLVRVNEKLMEIPFEELSPEEQKYRNKLVRLCQTISSDFEIERL